MPRWNVYILRCVDGTLYTGITNDLPKRLARHNAGTGAKYTRSRGPCVLAYARVMRSATAARKREYAIKRMTRTEKLALIAQIDAKR